MSRTLLATALVAALLLAGCSATKPPAASSTDPAGTSATSGTSSGAPGTATSTASTGPPGPGSPTAPCPTEPPRTTGPRRLPAWHPPASALPASGNYVYLDSDATDFAGFGRTFLLSKPCTFTVSEYARIVRFIVDADSDWDFQFERPASQPRLAVGTYANVTTPHVNGEDEAGMDAHSYHVCTSVRATFTVDDVGYDENGVLTRLTLRFEQHCQDAASALLGQLHWEA